MKKYLFILIILLCSQVLQAKTKPKLFSSDWPVWYLLQGMQQEHLLDDFDYKNVSYDTCLKWFEAGNLDVTFMTFYDFIALQPTKEPTVILAITDYSYGGDKIILKNTIKTGDKLKNKKIILSSDSISLWLLHNYLQTHQLTLNDVELVNQKTNLAPLQFNSSNEFSAVVGWEPAIDKAITPMSYLAASSAQYPEVIYDLLVAKKSFVDQHPDKVQQLISNFYQHSQSASVIKSTADTLNVSSQEYQSRLKSAYSFKKQQQANKQKDKLVQKAVDILHFLSLPPKSLNNENAREKFKTRTIDIETLIN